MIKYENIAMDDSSDFSMILPTLLLVNRGVLPPNRNRSQHVAADCLEWWCHQPKGEDHPQANLEMPVFANPPKKSMFFFHAWVNN